VNIFPILLLSLAAAASENEPLVTKWSELKNGFKGKQHAICSDMRGSAFLNRIEKRWYLYATNGLKDINESKQKVKSKCEFWDSHKQDASAGTQLAEARDELAQKTKSASHVLELLSKDIDSAKPHMKELWADGCIYRMESLKSDMQGHIEGLKELNSTECP
jgi:hypothetical protein